MSKSKDEALCLATNALNEASSQLWQAAMFAFEDLKILVDDIEIHDTVAAEKITRAARRYNQLCWAAKHSSDAAKQAHNASRDTI